MTQPFGNNPYNSPFFGSSQSPPNQGTYNGNNPYYGSGFGIGFSSTSNNGAFCDTPTKKLSEVNFSWIFLIFSLLAAVISYLLGEGIYRLFFPEHTVLGIGVYFATFGFILWLMLFIAARISKLHFSAKSILIPLFCIWLLFGLGMVFEFIYEKDFSTAPIPDDNYIFMIDNSDSMNVNDPGQKRIAALEQILDSKADDFPFAVYTFGYEIACLREMAPLSEGIGNLTVQATGGTPILQTLNLILNDMDYGNLPYNEGTQVILLTDGTATESDLLAYDTEDIIRAYKKKGIRISTIGIGYVDEAFLKNLSDKTGGISMMIDDVDELDMAISSVMQTTDHSRNLLSVRDMKNQNGLYGVMRFVFLMILGIIMIGIKLAVTDRSANAMMIVSSSVIAAVIGSVIMEIGLALLLPEFIGRMVLIGLFSLMITSIERIITIGYGTGYISRL